LLTIPGKDPEWSPDGKRIVYVRDRQILPVARLTAEHGLVFIDESFYREEVWIIKVDGTEDPRFLARGCWPSWSSDSKRIFYQSRIEKKLYSISIADGVKATPIIWCPAQFPVLSPDEKYVAYAWMGELRIIELSSKSVISTWTVPSFTVAKHFPVRWSPGGEELCVTNFNNLGLWIYGVKNKMASKVLSGDFEKCSWSPSDQREMAIGIAYGILYHEIWIADTEAFGPDRTIEQHCQEMVDYHTRGIEIDPEEGWNYLSRAKYYIYLQNKEEAFADLEKNADILRNPSEAAEVYHKVAWDLVCRPQRLVNPQIIVELFRKAHETAPEEWRYLNCLGIAHYRAGQWEEAITELTKSTELVDGENSWNFLSLAMAYWQLDDKTAAADWYNKAIEWMQKHSVNIGIEQWTPLYSFYLEAVELMGVKMTEFNLSPLSRNGVDY
jgi:hypothetical protein